MYWLLTLFILSGFAIIFIYFYTHKTRNREDLSAYDQHSEPLFSDAPASSAHTMLEILLINQFLSGSGYRKNN